MPQLASAKQGKNVLDLIDDATMDEVQNLIRNGDLLKRMLGCDLSKVNRQAFEQLLTAGGHPLVSTTELIFGKYNSAAQQIANQLVWDAHFGLSFGERRITEMAETVPDFKWDPAYPQRALVLCASRNTLLQTVQLSLAIMKFVYGEEQVYPSGSIEQLDHDSLYLPEGAPEFIPNRLWWEVLDLGANRDKAPDQVEAADAAATQVFSAACHHPAAVRAHNGGNNPYWDVPGLRVKVPGESGPYAPYVRGDSGGDVSVDADLASDAFRDYSEPVVLREW